MVWRKTARIFFVFMASTFGVIALLFIVLNLPFLEGFVTRQTNQILGNANIPIHIDAVRRVMPYSVKIQGILITDLKSDTIIHVGELKTNFKLGALARKEIVLKDLDLNQASIDLLMNYKTRKYNIAESFAADRQPNVDQSAKKKTTWIISIRKGTLSSTHFQMLDSLSGVYIVQDISGLKLKKFSVSLSDREILANTLELENATGNIILGADQEGEKERKEKGLPWNYSLLNLSLEDINFAYSDSSEGFRLETILGEGKIRANEMDMQTRTIDIRKISLARSSTILFTGNPSQKSETSGETAHEKFQWNIRSKAIDLEDVNFEVGREYKPYTDSLENKFKVSGLNMKLNELLLDEEHAGVDIKKLGFTIENGFTVKDIQGKLNSDPLNTELRIGLKTDHSILNLEGSAEESLFGLVSNPGEIAKARLAISETELGLEDISFFIPDLQDQSYYKTLTGKPYSIGGELDIAKSTYSFSRLTLSQDKSFVIRLEGSTENPLLFSEPIVNLNIGISDIDMNWLKDLLGAFGMENRLCELKSLSLQSTISEAYISPDFQIELKSSLGNLEASGTIDFKSDSFLIRSSFDRVELGEIMKNPEIGSFSGSAIASGMGFSPETLRSDIVLLVDTLNYNNYTYSHTNIRGKLHPGEYEFDVRIDDPSLKADLSAVLQPGDSIFMIQASGSASSQLNALHFYKDTLYAKTTINGHLIKIGEALEAEISLNGTSMITPRDSATIQQMDALFKTDSSGSMLKAEADFFHMDFKSARPFSELDSIGFAYGKYLETFADQHHENASTRVQELPEINSAGEIRYHDALGLLIQDTSLLFTGLDFSVVNKPSDQRIDYKIKGRGIEYKSVKIGTLNTSISDTAGILNVQITADDNTINSSPTNKLRIKSRFSEGQSLSELTLLDKGDRLVYGMEVASVLDSMRIVFSIPSRELIMNREHWKLDSTSLLTVNTRTKTFSPNLRMRSDNSLLELITEGENEYLNYRLFLDKVEFSSLLQEGLISGGPEGSISGSLDYKLTGDIEHRLNTNLDINDLQWSGLNFNHIGVKGVFSIDSSKAYDIDMSVLLDSSRLLVKGKKIHGGRGRVQTEFFSFPIRTFQPFVKEYLSGLQGNLSGKFNLSSSGDEDNIMGKLYINDANLRINTLNARYRIPEDSVRFSGKKVFFDKFRIADSLDNMLLVDGIIGFNDQWSPYTDMEVSSTKLQVMNRSEKEDVPLYGDIFVDSRLSFKGPLVNPDIKGQILLSEGTDIFYRYMEDLSISETEKIVSFVSQSSPADPEMGNPIRMSGTAMNSSIETIVKIDPTTRINFNLAKRIYNIKVMIKGGGTLNYNMVNNNQVALSGKYEIREGTADLKLIGWPNKAFSIAEGGFIRWDGLLDNPELNFEALSRVSSSYINPVDGAQRNVDFNVILKLSNQLSDLDILFTINTSDQYLMSIINTLSPEEQMRQAITILLFEYVDLPGISTSSNYMTQQVSQLLASQLNELAKTTIQGVDISFGIDTYTAATESGGEETKTSLSYEVRKSFLNDRAQIEFSGRFDDLTQQQGNTDMSMNNLSFEYRLDSAASKFLKVYNEHSYEDVFTGEIVKTGVGFTYRKRYQYFKDIWRRKTSKPKAESQDK